MTYSVEVIGAYLDTIEAEFNKGRQLIIEELKAGVINQEQALKERNLLIQTYNDNKNFAMKRAK